MEYMLMPLKRYADFQGRSRRKEYWMFTLGIVIVYMLLMIPMMSAVISAAASGRGNDPQAALSMFTGIGGIGMVLLTIFALAIFIPSLAVQIRRLHDTDRSGWWILLGFVPIVNYIGIWVLLVFYCLEGTKGPNRFGEDPKTHQNLTDVFS